MRKWVLFCLILAAAVIGITAQPSGDSTVAEMAAKSRILLANGGSPLENAVTRILTDSLSRRGYSVTVQGVENVAVQNPRDYEAIVFMSAIRASKVDPRIRSFIDKVEIDNADRDRILFATVRGERWDTTEARTSAVTAATKSYKPVPIVSRLLKELGTVLYWKR